MTETDAATKKFIEEHRNDDIRTLALQAARYPNVSMHHALTQIEGWQCAKEKLPAWAATEGMLYPPKISMEQCSSQDTALYKASLMQGDTFADLTGGFGIDCSYISKNFSRSTYIERNEQLCRIAQHNFETLGLKINVVNSHCEEALHTLHACDWIFADPARRNNSGGKVVALADCEPNITAIEELILSRCKHAMIKCSPMLDITAACRQISSVNEVHIVSVNNECKEVLLLLSGEQRNTPIAMHCVNITGNDTVRFSCHAENDGNITYTQNVEAYIYEPNASIQKAGCHTALARKFNIAKLHPNSHIYTSAHLEKEFPGRIFHVESICGFSKNEIKKALGDVKKANITIRNFPDTVLNLRKRLKIEEGGDIYIFATTLYDGRKVLLKCKKA